MTKYGLALNAGLLPILTVLIIGSKSSKSSHSYGSNTIIVFIASLYILIKTFNQNAFALN